MASSEQHPFVTIARAFAAGATPRALLPSVSGPPGKLGYGMDAHSWDCGRPSLRRPARRHHARGELRSLRLRGHGHGALHSLPPLGLPGRLGALVARRLWGFLQLPAGLRRAPNWGPTKQARSPGYAHMHPKIGD